MYTRRGGGAHAFLGPAPHDRRASTRVVLDEEGGGAGAGWRGLPGESRRRVIRFVSMGLPPHSFGDRVRTVRLERVAGPRWRVTVGEQPLASTFESEREARNAAAAEELRLDALALALLRRARSGPRRKQP